MSKMVAALYQEGLIKRLKDRDDGRGVLVASTPKGRRVCQQARRLCLERLADALEALPKGQLSLIRQLTSILEQLDSRLD